MQDFKLTRSKLGLFSVPVFLSFIFPVVVCALAEQEAVSPQGSGFLNFVVYLALFILCLLFAGACLVSAVFLLFPSVRLGALISFLICLASAICFMGGCFAGGSISNHICRNALGQLAERSKPLISAIKSYEHKLGHPPASLDALVPEFISKVPTTGIGASPDFQYRSLTNSSSYGNNKWVLEVNEPAGAAPFTTLIYLPLQDYSVLRHGFIVWRIGDWAYWHQG
jgi:hypothetical protein